MRLFTSEKIPAYLDDMTHRLHRRDEAEVPIVDLAYRLQPFTPDLAGELDGAVRRTLFRLSDGEPAPHLVGAIFKVANGQQQNVVVHSTPDTKKPKFAMIGCALSKTLRVRADADMPGFVATFRVSMEHPSGDELAYFQEALHKQMFLTFQPTQGDMLDELPEQGRPDEAREEELIRGAEAEEASEFASARREAVDEIGEGGGLEPARTISRRRADRKKRSALKETIAKVRKRRTRKTPKGKGKAGKRWRR